ncbi:MAG: pyridoxamine 5'-phosphate oxidase family protein [Candidatus Limnocylindrales bacterium]
MSVAVSLQELYERIETCGPQAFLVTVSEGGDAHVVSVVVRREGDALAFDAGRTSRANLAVRPTATLLWPSRSFDNGEYSLIVDGDGVVAGGEGVVVNPTAAVLHRIAGTDGGGPSCIRVMSRD